MQLSAIVLPVSGGLQGLFMFLLPGSSFLIFGSAFRSPHSALRVEESEHIEAARKVLKIAPVPEGMGTGSGYTININFELE